MSGVWVDEKVVEIAPPDTWPSLGLDSLFVVKNQLLDKLFLSRGMPAYQVPLNRALAQVEVFISQKMGSSAF
jgi:hypothetical protein